MNREEAARTLLTAAEMRAFDAAQIAAGVPSLLLMENAGRAAAEVIADDLRANEFQSDKIVVLCGSGNNGGDGYVVARRLITLGFSVVVHAWQAPKTAEAQTMHDAFAAVASSPISVGELPDLKGAIAIDALFGVGLSRGIVSGSNEAGTGRTFAADDVAAWVLATAAAARVYALDVPSGLNADTGAVDGVAVCASITIAFGFAKRGHYTPIGAEFSGRRVVVDIGVPSTRLSKETAASAPQLDDADSLAPLLPQRGARAHKYTAGSVLLAGGAPGKTGALLLAGDGAFGAGAGLVTLSTYGAALPALEIRVKEAMTAAFDADDLSALFFKKRVFAIGPGFGLDTAAEQLFERLVAAWPVEAPLVIDADGLTLLARAPQCIAHRAAGTTILTPHAAEAARLHEMGTTASLIENDRFRAIEELAQKWRSVIVLKGAHTLVRGAGAKDRVYVATTGGPSLAVGGTGDVLAGAVAALAAAMGMHVLVEAARIAVHLHGAAADAWVQKNGPVGLRAGALAAEIPAAWGRLASHTPCGNRDTRLASRRDERPKST